MTKREAAIVSAYTGYLLGDFDDMHKYIEEIMGGPIFTHELGNQQTLDAIQDKSKADFIALVVEG